jgi:hypothetical protein
MKRMLIVTLLAVGLAAVAGSISDRNKLVADGEPPPPFPPKPPALSSIPFNSRTMWLTADGEPPPPFPPKPPAESPAAA